MLLFRQARFTFDHVAGVLLKGKSKNASKKQKTFFTYLKVIGLIMQLYGQNIA